MCDIKLVLSWIILENIFYIIWIDGCNEYISIVK